MLLGLFVLYLLFFLVYYWVFMNPWFYGRLQLLCLWNTGLT